MDYVVYFQGYLAMAFQVVPSWDCLIPTLSDDGQDSESVWMIPTWEAFERASV